MAIYSNVKRATLRRASAPGNSELKGVALECGAFKRWHPIRPGICATEPCPCDGLDDAIIWLPTSNRVKLARIAIPSINAHSGSRSKSVAACYLEGSGLRQS
jgi:hypothetical protein